jgi:hypothetical protein
MSDATAALAPVADKPVDKVEGAAPKPEASTGDVSAVAAEGKKESAPAVAEAKEATPAKSTSEGESILAFEIFCTLPFQLFMFLPEHPLSHSRVRDSRS